MDESRLQTANAKSTVQSVSLGVSERKTRGRSLSAGVGRKTRSHLLSVDRDQDVGFCHARSDLWNTKQMFWCGYCQPALRLLHYVTYFSCLGSQSSPGRRSLAVCLTSSLSTNRLLRCSACTMATRIHSIRGGSNRKGLRRRWKINTLSRRPSTSSSVLHLCGRSQRQPPAGRSDDPRSESEPLEGNS